MCTAIWFNKQHMMFGRNMDISYSFGEEIVIMPRSYSIQLKCLSTIESHYGIIGMACVVDGVPLFSDGMNEHGLCIAALNFQGYAYYIEELHENKVALAPYDIIPYLLGTFKNVNDVKDMVEFLEVVRIPYGGNFPLPYLHWMISDQNECVVLESVKDGIHLYNNSVGVMTNNPEFPFHMSNLNQYLNLSTQSLQSDFGKNLNLQPLGHGMGGFGLPGDTSTVSRFIRGVFVKESALSHDDIEYEIAQCFRILGQVSVVQGAVLLENNMYDYTTYTSCMVPKLSAYFYTTYYNQQITQIIMNHEQLEAENLFRFSLEQNPVVKREKPLDK